MPECQPKAAPQAPHKTQRRRSSSFVAVEKMPRAKSVVRRRSSAGAAGTVFSETVYVGSAASLAGATDYVATEVRTSSPRRSMQASGRQADSQRKRLFSSFVLVPPDPSWRDLRAEAFALALVAAGLLVVLA